MTRREFSTMGLTTAALSVATSAAAKAGQTSPGSPSNLADELPTAYPAPRPCTELPRLPEPAQPEISQSLLPGFRSQFLQTSGATIRVLTKGDGPPLLLLHGHPETHVTWHKIAPTLAEEYAVILPDLRGYGDSSKPEGGPQHKNYSFRAMALDQIEVMNQLGHKRFMVAGHDRGGRVAHRLCLDHPDAVEKVAVLDIAPTLTMYNDTSKEFATKYVWWFLQIQPAPMPEHLIELDSTFYLRDHLAVQGKTPGAVTPEAMGEYMRCYCCRGTIHAICEDYRAAAGIDLEMDRADDAAAARSKLRYLRCGEPRVRSAIFGTCSKPGVPRPQTFPARRSRADICYPKNSLSLSSRSFGPSSKLDRNLRGSPSRTVTIPVRMTIR